MHEYLLDDLSTQEGYKLLRDIVTPRPIALVTTVGTDGLVNACLLYTSPSPRDRG